MTHIIAVDGHDGSGKTSVAQALAHRLNGTYVKPFAGLLGDHIAWLWRNNKHELANTVALSAVEMQIAKHGGENKTLVFDRHWLTMFTVLPQRYWAQWDPRPLTFLCWTDPSTTMARLLDRDGTDGEDLKYDHKKYCDLYRAIAEQKGATVIDTSKSTVNQTTDHIISLLRHELAIS